jgi:hypothetical protein
MFASDVIRRNRNVTIAFNLQEQQAAFDAGLTNYIPRQKGGTDYKFITNISQAEAETPQLLLTPIVNLIKLIIGQNRTITVNLIEFTRIDFNQIDDRRPTLLTDGSGNYILDGSGNITRDSSGNPLLTASGNPVLDDASIRIPNFGMKFNFFGINYGDNNDIYWNTNNVITFGNNYNLDTVSFNPNTIPAILLGNYDRLCSELYHKNSAVYNSNALVATIKTIVVEFADYYTDTSNFEAGKYQIRFIREAGGERRQWVEVSVISSPLHPGYSTNVTGPTNPAGYNFDASGNRASMIDSNGNTVNPTKLSPYDITDGTAFLNAVGTTYSEQSPPNGTSFVYQGDSTGYSWQFINNAYLDI